jgi:hypothetical protein
MSDPYMAQPGALQQHAADREPDLAIGPTEPEWQESPPFDGPGRVEIRIAWANSNPNDFWIDVDGKPLPGNNKAAAAAGFDRLGPKLDRAGEILRWAAQWFPPLSPR